MTTLCQLLSEARHPSSTVAHRLSAETRTDSKISWQDFRRHVSDLRAKLAPGPAGGWVLLTEDAYAFAVGLLALWHSGRYAISPPNHQPGALLALRTRAGGVISDRPDWFPGDACLDPLASSDGRGSDDFAPLDPEAPAIELYTSGTTGTEKPVVKRIRHLHDEVAELGEAWNELVGDATLFATASHQHLYGLLFGVLWPLCAERAFQSQHLLHAGELIPRLRAAESWALAGVPTHLRRFARQLNGESLGSSCRVVFSSGGPLDRETALEIAQRLGQPPLEVLGSSETGGIAWRTQGPDTAESLWRTFPSVQIHRDAESGVLRVRSPFVSVDAGSAGFATGDLVSIRPDGAFSLAGRASRMVKIAEKRLDLNAMESQLRGHEWIAELTLGTLDRDGDPRVVAAIVPTEDGWDQIRTAGQRAFVDGLRANLTREWDPVLHPRYWRTVRTLPENQQGKVTLQALEDLFANPEFHRLSDRPAVVDEIRDVDFLERSCFVPVDLACFPGHFPGLAVVPGVLQLDWALEAAAEWLGRTLQVEEIESLKMLAPLMPGARFRIRVCAGTKDRLQLRIFDEDRDFATARVRLAKHEGERS